MSEATIAQRPELLPEDEARAEFYALLARLFSDAPDAALLSAIAAAPPLEPAARSEDAGAAGGLVPAWNAVRTASAVADATAIRDEFQALFVGVGRSEVSLYASHYIGPQSGRPRAETSQTRRFAPRLPTAGLAGVRGSPVGRAGNDAHAGRRRRGTIPGDDRCATRVLRSSSGSVGSGLLRCNIGEFCCQLLPASSRIRSMFHGART